jgi:hypothetical protein
MQSITNSVGEGGANRQDDVALVQAILVKTQRSVIRPPLIAPTVGPYLKSYDGKCGKDTKDAIRVFQEDHVFEKNRSAPPGEAVRSLLAPLLGAVKAKPGVVEPDDETWHKLVECVPEEFRDLRVLKGGKTVYVAATANDLHDQLASAHAMTFEKTFFRKVERCMHLMFTQYGIAVGVCDKGDRRDFQTQDDLLNGKQHVTNAGPGESNHNFGMAVDLGFEGLRWLRPNGAVVEDEDSWMHKLDPHQNTPPEALRFWETLRAAGTSGSCKMFRGPLRDRPHLQNWTDLGVDMGHRLVDLLVRSGTMKWSVHHDGKHYQYKCDLGLGGDKADVGSASEIWNEDANITIPVLKTLRDAAAARAAKVAHSNTAPTPAAATVTEADVLAMKKALCHQFKLADENWRAWTPQ